MSYISYLLHWATMLPLPPLLPMQFFVCLLCVQAQQDGKFENKNIHPWLHPAKVSFIPAILSTLLLRA
jgi:hypothetical protein